MGVLLRWIVLLLLTLNVCYLLWALLMPEPDRHTGMNWPADVPELEVLPADTAARAVATGAEAGDGAEPAAGPRLASCWRIGPFTEPAQLESFVSSRLTGLQTAVIEEEQRIEGDWRVFLPPAPDRDSAIALRASFQSAAETAGEELESYVMTEGPRANGVSLGLFRQEANARSLAARVEALGLEVGVERESVFRPVQWVEVMVLDGWMDESRRSGLASYAAGLRVTENLCQTIAPQPYFP